MTSGANNDEYLTDSAILVCLSKKRIAEMTEKAVFWILSQKTSYSIEKVEKSLKRLLACEWVKRFSTQNMVWFELTLTGEKALQDFLSKEKAKEEAKIAHLVQEMIKEIRSNEFATLLETLYKIKIKYVSFKLPEKPTFVEIENKSLMLFSDTKDTENNQPHCNQYKPSEEYEIEFSEYKPEVEGLMQLNLGLIQPVAKYIMEIENAKAPLSMDLGEISRITTTLMNKDMQIWLGSKSCEELSFAKEAESKLRSIEDKLLVIEKEDLPQFAGLRKSLADNLSLLENLKKPTHKWETIAWSEFIKADERITDPEGRNDPKPPVKDKYPVKEKCTLCGIERQYKPVDMA